MELFFTRVWVYSTTSWSRFVSDHLLVDSGISPSMHLKAEEMIDGEQGIVKIFSEVLE